MAPYYALHLQGLVFVGFCTEGLELSRLRFERAIS
jgi:hypothetical protein